MLAVQNIEQKIELTKLQARILEILQVGHKNAIGLKDLCKRLSDKNEREVRLAIEVMRNEGSLILFGQKQKTKDKYGHKIVLPSGYYIGETYDESMEFYNYMKSRVIEECKIMRSIKTATYKKFSKSYGQIPLFFK